MATPLSPMRPKSNRFVTIQNGNENWTFALVLAVRGLLRIQYIVQASRYFIILCRWLGEYIALNSRSRQEQH